MAAAKIVGGYLAFDATEDGVDVENAFRGSAAQRPAGSIEAVPQHQDSGADQDQRPEIAPAEVEKPEILREEDAADDGQDDAGGAVAVGLRIHQFG